MPLSMDGAEGHPAISGIVPAVDVVGEEDCERKYIRVIRLSVNTAMRRSIRTHVHASVSATESPLISPEKSSYEAMKYEDGM